MFYLVIFSVIISFWKPVCFLMHDRKEWIVVGGDVGRNREVVEGWETITSIYFMRKNFNKRGKVSAVGELF